MIDYRDLLKRYMKTVVEQEGVYFIEWAKVSDEERAELLKIEDELYNATGEKK